MSVHRWGLSIELYGELVDAGVSHEELCDLAGAGFWSASWEAYLAARRVGATHEEILSIYVATPAGRGGSLDYRTGPLLEYCGLRQAGCPHAEIVEARDSGLTLGSYQRLREVVSHADALAARGRLVDINGYCRARAWSEMTHPEAVALGRTGRGFTLYESGRQAGHSHTRALADSLPFSVDGEDNHAERLVPGP
jgi:hypothetical protein